MVMTEPTLSRVSIVSAAVLNVIAPPSQALTMERLVADHADFLISALRAFVASNTMYVSPAINRTWPMASPIARSLAPPPAAKPLHAPVSTPPMTHITPWGADPPTPPATAQATRPATSLELWQIGVS